MGCGVSGTPGRGQVVPTTDRGPVVRTRKRRVGERSSRAEGGGARAVAWPRNRSRNFPGAVGASAALASRGRAAESVVAVERDDMVPVADETSIPPARRAISRAGFYFRMAFGVGSIGALLAGAGLSLEEPAWEPGAVGAGLALFAWLLLTLRSRRRDAGAPPTPAPCLALARIESRRATSSEGVDIPVDMDVTVSPDDGPAFRARTSHTVNLVDLPECRVGATIVVRYRPDTPWDVSVVDDPDATWADRAASEPLDSAPEHTRVTEPAIPALEASAAVISLLAGAAAILLVFPPW